MKEKIHRWSGRLAADFDLRLLSFDDHVREHEDIRQADLLHAEGKSTAIGLAVAGARGAAGATDGARALAKSEIEAIFLFSDGQNNSTRDPVAEAAALGVPVLAVGVGTGLHARADFKDIQVTGICCPERMMLKNKARIKVDVEAVGLGGRVVRLVLDEDSSQASEPKRNKAAPPPEVSAEETLPAGTASPRRIAEIELTLDDRDGPQEIAFEVRPEMIGRIRYIVRALPIAEETIRENNERQITALVAEPGMRVLYLEGTLRNEYGAITQRFLSKGPDIEFCAMVQTRPNMFSVRTNRDDLDIRGIPDTQETIDLFDVFIIGDIDSSYLKPPVQRMIVRRIEAGAGLIMLGGYHALGPGGYAGTPLGDILPVLLGDRDIGQFTDPFLPKLTPDGEKNPVFTNIVDFFPSASRSETREGMPPLDGCTNVLAAGPMKLLNDDREMPVLAVQPVGEGRTVVFTADTTRKWEQGPKALHRDTPFMQFWGQMVRYLAGRGGAVRREAGVNAMIDKAYYEPGEMVRLNATVRNAEGIGTERANVTATIRALDPPQTREPVSPDEATTTAFAPVAQAPGKFALEFVPNGTGAHEITVTARSDGVTHRAPEKILIDIGRPNMEFDRLDLNEELLNRIAEASQGRYAHLTTADFLIDRLNRDMLKRRIIQTTDLAPPVPSSLSRRLLRSLRGRRAGCCCETAAESPRNRTGRSIRS